MIRFVKTAELIIGKDMRSILVYLQWPANTGFAVGRLESVFARMAAEFCGSAANVHFAYPSFLNGMPENLPCGIEKVFQFDPATKSEAELLAALEYVKANKIGTAFGFDQPPSRLSLSYLRKGGVRNIVSYWGAPISSLYSGPALLARRIQYLLRRHCPDHYIFESEGMRRTATHGLGVPKIRTSVVPLGVDENQFKPNSAADGYAHDKFSIDRARKIVFYSGHMEERKGVHVIIKAARHLVESRGRCDLHFLFLGNKNGEELVFNELYKGSPTESFITFGGYRDDIAALQASSHMAVIASTGWDSHTMTSLEVASSGLPLIVSDIPGLQEVVTEETGFRFPAGDHLELADILGALADDESMRQRMGQAARRRILAGFTLDHQIRALRSVLENVELKST